MVLFNFIRINPQVEYCKFGRLKNYVLTRKAKFRGYGGIGRHTGLKIL